MPDFERCPCAGGTLDKLVRPAILSVLAAGPLHGYRLVEKLGSLGVSRGVQPDPTGVYRALRSMQRMRLVAARWDVSGPGPAKHVFRLTPAGKACLRTWVETLTTYRYAIDELLVTARHAPKSAKGSAKKNAKRSARR